MSDTVTQTDTDTELDFPALWGVRFLNDDYTPIDFVVMVLKQFFGFTDTAAAEVTLKVHEEGEAIVGAYTKDIAQTKASSAEQAARQYGHPLRLDAVEV